MSETASAWSASAPGSTPGPTISFSFNLAKIPDQGEDSDPILRDGPDLGLVAVFDGMGGAGGTVYETPDGRRTGAYLASRSPETSSSGGCWSCSNRTGTSTARPPLRTFNGLCSGP